MDVCVCACIFLLSWLCCNVLVWRWILCVSDPLTPGTGVYCLEQRYLNRSNPLRLHHNNHTTPIQTAPGQSEPEAAYAEGFWLGFVGEDNLPGTQAGIRYVNNHADITVLYHEDPASYEGVRIVGIEVEPRSVRHVVEGEGSSGTFL